MAIKSLIFDYQTAEDEYTASDFREVYKHFVSNGVLLEKGDSLLDNTKCKVVAIEGGVRISNGTAQINGSQAIITDEDILIETDGTYKIVLEWNVVLNKFVAKAITDSALTRTDTVYQIQLAAVVKSGSTYTVADTRSDEAICGFANRMLDNQADNLKAQIGSGWNLIPGTFTYSNTTTITTSVDCTGFLSAGMKIKCTNGTVKMGVIKSVTSTTIVLESSVLASGAITNVYFSVAQVPYGAIGTNIMTAYLTSNYSVSQQNIWINLPLVQFKKLGDKLSISSGGVRIGKGVSYVKTSANLEVASSGATGSVYIGIQKNSTTVFENLTVLWNAGAEKCYTLSASPILIDVVEGDIISLAVLKYEESAGNVLSAVGIPSDIFTGLTVEVVG